MMFVYKKKSVFFNKKFMSGRDALVNLSLIALSKTNFFKITRKLIAEEKSLKL